MAEKQKTTTTKSNGRERERTAIQALAQAVRLVTHCMRKVHPGSLTDETEQLVGRHLEAAESAIAWAE